jgi:molecular chaperone DnaK (HSP70)
MHENTAFAFKYGFDKESEFTAGQDTNVLFYNMGAASYQVGEGGVKTV